jgi:hypothetical protein
VFVLGEKWSQKFVTELLGMAEGNNTTPSFREEAPRRKSKSNYWQPKKPKGPYMGMILGEKFCRVFRQNKVCFFAEFCSSSANWTKFAIF